MQTSSSSHLSFKKTFDSIGTQRDGKTGKAHHDAVKGKGFVNPWPSFVDIGPKEFLKTYFSGGWDSERSKSPPENERVAVIRPDFEKIDNFDHKSIQVTWLGHAAFLIQMGGLRILADPCCSERCAPVQWAGPKRIRPMPCSIQELGNIDAVIISHSHYDHLDYNTIKTLGSSVSYFVPLGNLQWFKSNFSDYPNVMEMDWWDEFKVKGTSRDGKTVDVTVACTPCQHFSGRWINDRNHTLWSSWVVRDDVTSKRLFFGGDTGYRSVPKGFDGNVDTLPNTPCFKEIGETYGPFDLSLIPIGAYSPRHIMSPVHCDPADAVRVHLDIGSKQSIGMHHSTFILTDEPVLEPPQLLKKMLDKYNVPQSDFIGSLKIGESYSV